MANPYTKTLGYMKAWPVHLGDDEDYLVLFDRRKSDPRGELVYEQPWEVRHMKTGNYKRYGQGEKGKAEIDSATVARSVTLKQWWK